jgi:hypothetical protein
MCKLVFLSSVQIVLPANFHQKRLSLSSIFPVSQLYQGTFMPILRENTNIGTSKIENNV